MLDCQTALKARLAPSIALHREAATAVGSRYLAFRVSHVESKRCTTAMFFTQRFYKISLQVVAGSIPDEVIGFFSYPILPAALWPWGRLSL
jgi:cell shape-determining protein MreD